MKSLVLSLAALAALALAGPVRAAPAAPAKPPAHVVKLTNGDSQGITAIYASPPGKNDWGDDLLGKQTAAAGRTVTLAFRDAAPEACTQDLQMLMNDGKVVTKAAFNVCETADYKFTR